MLRMFNIGQPPESFLEVSTVLDIHPFLAGARLGALGGGFWETPLLLADKTTPAEDKGPPKVIGGGEGTVGRR